MNTPSLQKRLGSAMRRRRECLGIGQEAFAGRIRMHRAYFSAIESGEKDLQLSTLGRVCTGLGISVWEVLREAENLNPLFNPYHSRQSSSPSPTKFNGLIAREPPTSFS